MGEEDTNGKEESSESAIGAFLFIATGGITGGAVAYAVMTIVDIFISVYEPNLIYSLAEAGIAISLTIFYMQIFQYSYLYIIDWF
ncbi:hypothetical protein [Natrinema salsiterrestre]|uniref:Uncharacterized protein n=1 Tax=Natrinema salsiterrestre TaxID=2950540 RepID=A0A9Q4L4Q4_9EURY|nr:hypothetical protein [Natrinema salsiterrestre]MDF9745271.1 hypothetical protein [Natrinema salsiterrestre]